MKKFERISDDSSLYIKSSRIIDPLEWKKFNESMEKAREEYRIKSIKSEQSAKDVWLD